MSDNEKDAIEQKIEKVLDEKLSEMVEERSKDEAIEETIEEVEGVTVEDPMLTEFGSDRGKDDDSRLQFVREWFPSENDYRGKTRISPRQARALTVLRHLPDIYGKELLGEDKESLSKLLNSLGDNIEIYQTSIGGESRSEQKDILELAFGGHSEKMQSQESSMLDRYMAEIDEKEE